MGIGRWIGGFLGFINGGPLGALAGYAIGWLFEKGAEGFSDNADNTFDNGTYRNSNAYGGYSVNSSMRASATRSSSRCSCSPHIS